MESHVRTRHISQSPWRWRLVLAGNALMALMNGYDVSSTASIQVPMYKTFGQTHLIVWINMAYPLVNVATVPSARSLLALLEPKRVGLVSCLLIATGSLVCATAVNAQSVVAGRACVGLACALLFQVTTTYNMVLAKPRQLATVQATQGGAFAVGLVAGPVVGGAVAEAECLTWRVAFYFVFAMAAASAVGLVLYPTMKASTSANDGDWLGCFLHLCVFLVLGVASVTSGPTWSWTSPATVVIWSTLALLMLTYASQQAIMQRQRRGQQAIPLNLLGRKAIFLLFVSTASISMAYGITLYFMPIYYGFTRRHGALQSAVHILPFMASYVIVLFISSRILPRARYYRPLYMLTATLILAGAGMLQTIGLHGPDANLVFAQILLGAGIGASWPLFLCVANTLVTSDERPDTVCAYLLSVQGGIAVGLCVTSVIYQNVGPRLVGHGDDDLHRLLAAFGSPGPSAANSLTTDAAAQAVTETVKACFYVTLAAGAVLSIAACCMDMEALPFGSEGDASEENIVVTPSPASSA